MILPFPKALDDPQHDTLFERLMHQVLEDNETAISAVFAEPGIGKSAAVVLAAQKAKANQSCLTIVLQGKFDSRLRALVRVPPKCNEIDVAESLFEQLAALGIRLQLVFDNTFDAGVPELLRSDLMQLTRSADSKGHHLIIICQSREGAVSVDCLNGGRSRIAPQQNGSSAEAFRWSCAEANSYLNATVMSELKASGDLDWNAMPMSWKSG